MRTVACGNFILLTSLDKSMICGIISAVSLAERKALRLPPLPRRSADAVLTASQKCRWGKHFCFIVKYPQ